MSKGSKDLSDYQKHSLIKTIENLIADSESRLVKMPGKKLLDEIE